MKIDINTIARKVGVDNRIPLHYYYRIADNLLKQASVYREEKNIVDLYIILVRYSSLVSETIPYHRDYQVLCQKERKNYNKKLLATIDELESLKPEFQRQVEELNKPGAQPVERDGHESTGYASGAASQWSSTSRNAYLTQDSQWPGSSTTITWKYKNDRAPVSSYSSAQLDRQFEKLSVGLPPPKKETLSRHSFLGPNGLNGQWQGPTAGIKVQYPSSKDLIPADNLSIDPAVQYDLPAVEDAGQGGAESVMDSVLSLDDGRWSHPAEASVSALTGVMRDDPFQFVSIGQPSPPPVLAKVQQDFTPIPPSQVADPRPGPACSQQSPSSYQHLHVPVNMMEDFLRLARKNTSKNLETCGILAGSLKNKVFHITTLIIPKQESTSDSCQTLNEEEIFEVQDRLSLFPLGWIHTHPSQTCFMSSVDLHTHYSYQIMLPEAIAIVMAPTDTSSPHGIFHLSDPSGVNVIRNCQQRGFHPHEEPSDGSPIYEHCSHVYMNSKLRFEVIDLR